MSESYSEQLRAAIEPFPVISFDVFDTLLKRDVARPADIFEIVQQRFNEAGNGKTTQFPRLRNLAARMAYRLTGREEVSLDDIYRFLPYSERQKAVLQQLELDAEHEFAARNQPMFDIVRHCQAQGKKVYAVSDMYLDQDFIMSLLKKCGYELDGVYVSSRYQATKVSSRLFGCFLKDLGISAEAVLHVGDSQAGDVEGAARAGIRSFKIPTRLERTRYFQPHDAKDEMALSVLQAFINNRIQGDGSRLEQIGYEVLGPFLYGFCRWLHENAVRNGVRRIFFFARDARLTMEIYQTIYGEEAIPSEYLYVSRRSLLTPYYFSIGKRTDDEARSQYEAFQAYARQAGLLEPGAIAAVDDGGYCRPQFMLKALIMHFGGESVYHSFNFELVKGYRTYMSDENCYSYLFRGKTSPTRMIVSNGLFEALISAVHGTTYGYELTDGGARPVLATVDHVSGKIEEIQRGAMRFARDWSDSPFRTLTFAPDRLIQPFFNLALDPLKEDVDLLGSTEKVEDLDAKFIIYKGLAHYRGNIRDWLKDFQNSHWKGGFLKKSFARIRFICNAYLFLNAIRLFIWKPRVLLGDQ